MKAGSRSPIAYFLIGLACLVGGPFILALTAFGSGALKNQSSALLPS